MSLVSACDGIAASQEAAFRVESSIAVREEYKTKLRTLVNALLPSTKASPSIAAGQPSPHNESASPKSTTTTTDASRKKQTRDAIADRLRVRATMPVGKELQVVGDWLLLLRAASVNVVESIAHWRIIIHQGLPLRYETDHINYLLQMAHDVDFLDQCDDLVAWLSFRLARNPFIVAGGLDGSTNDNVTQSVSSPGLEDRQGESKRPTYPSPPSTLVKPLVSITPEDDVVDGSRIAKAHVVLQDEEALNGRATTLRVMEAHFAKPLEASLLHVDDDEDDDACNQNGHAIKSTVFDEIAAMTKAARHVEHRLHCLQREHTRATDFQKLVVEQIRCTTIHRELDLVSDHRVWSYRDKCREATLRSSHRALEELNHRVESLDDAMAKVQAIISKRKQRLAQLVDHKDRTRQLRQEEKRRVETEEIARRTGAIRRKTLERNREFKTKRAKSKPHVGGDAAVLPASALHGEREPTNYDLVDEIAMTVGVPASPMDHRVELDHLRIQNLERRRQQRLHHEQVLSDALREMNRRREENASMFLEDKLSGMVESHRRRLIHERLRKEREKNLAATPICSIVQAVGGAGNNETKFVISVYQHHATGYAPHGLRFVAYDPSTSKSFSLVMSTREYNSLGYGRTLDGLSAFCQWLCVVYDKRTRQFKLMWSGAPCPPPLRLREYDHVLVCVHKEGMRLMNQPSFVVAAVYIRTNDPSKLRFVVSPVNAGVDIVEYAVAGSQLLPTTSILLRSEFENGQPHASWLHTLDKDSFDAGWGHGPNGSHRVYSGEMAAGEGKRSTRVHVYDASPTEYEMHIHNDDRQSEGDSQQTIALLKHDVNPYRVRLPGSAFGDLVGCLKLERRHHDGTQDAETPALRAVILPSWRAFLARYVRALRMARFGAKIDGVFCLIVVTLVQQKTEFRAHLLFELVPLADTGSRHVLRISLSQFLRCPGTNWRCTGDGTMDDAEWTHHCDQCLENHRLATTAPVADASCGEQDPENESHEPCSSCDATQRNRLAIVRLLLDTGALSSESDLTTLYYATCSSCGVVSPPIALVIPIREDNICTADEKDGQDAILRHYFSCFDGAAESLQSSATAIRNMLEHSRICVIRLAASSIGTHTNAVFAAEHVRGTLQLEPHGGLSVTIAVVYRRLDIFNLVAEQNGNEVTSIPRHVLEQTLRDTATAILHVGDSVPIAIDAAEDEQHGIVDFEGYLVSEALLVEATSVVLHPGLEWRVPGETVGASSWSSACEFLRNPRQLSRDLQARLADFLAMHPVARQTLEAYAAHPKWPTNLEDVRTPFQALLSCVLHIVYIQHLLTIDGGLFSSAAVDQADDGTVDADGGGIYDVENGVKVIVSRYQ